ncbi:MAG TPA: invasion associated locus B family protein [Stellaceae bacterium]|jgi:hypothetical protein|nr:invasion associated locus B family protein [Stellaceae bacterium]
MIGPLVAFAGNELYGAAMMSVRRYLFGALAVLATAPAAFAASTQTAHHHKHHHVVTKHHKTGHAAAPAAAPVPAGTESLGKAGSWAAYMSQDKTGKVCYLVGQPERTAPGGFARKAPTAMVTHRPAENIANVVSFVEGYTLKDGSDVALDVGGAKFDLFTKDDSAWARTSDLDKTIVGTLAKSRSAVVKGTPQKGPATTDTYVLAGFPKALALIDKACGVKR